MINKTTPQTKKLTEMRKGDVIIDVFGDTLIYESYKLIHDKKYAEIKLHRENGKPVTIYIAFSEKLSYEIVGKEVKEKEKKK